jgi:hypothetical protein
MPGSSFQLSMAPLEQLFSELPKSSAVCGCRITSWVKFRCTCTDLQSLRKSSCTGILARGMQNYDLGYDFGMFSFEPEAHPPSAEATFSSKNPARRGPKTEKWLTLHCTIRLRHIYLHPTRSAKEPIWFRKVVFGQFLFEEPREGGFPQASRAR